MAANIQRPKGTLDVIPADVHRWHYVEGYLRNLAETFGFHEIRFPTFEHTELFIRGVGDTTDVVQKEMYTFEDKGGRSITLRPEGTASTVRAYLENSLHAQGGPFKAYYIVPNFRYEQPQSGRYREHHQFGVECFGAAAPAADAEIISFAHTFLAGLGVKDVALHINSIGCPSCRKVYYEALRDYFRPHLDELCDTCKARFEKNPMRLLDCKSEICRNIAKGAPHVVDYLCDDCAEHFKKVQAYLADAGIEYSIDPTIVRGLDYYTRTVFEFVTALPGAQGTVLGGGRYDGLIGQLGGQETPGIGFGCGLERLIAVMRASDAYFPAEPAPQVFIASIGEAADLFAQKLTLELRRMGVRAERDIVGRSVKAQMKNADRLGAEYSIVIGDGELESGAAVLKFMREKKEVQVFLDAAAVKAAVEGN